MIDVVIIGGGLAGLTAATALLDAGIATVLLEARDRVGGRIYTSFADSSNSPVDLGGERIGEEHRAIRAMCDSRGIRLVDSGSLDEVIPQVIVLGGRTLSEREVTAIRKECRRLVEHLDGLAKDLSRAISQKTFKTDLAPFNDISVESWLGVNGYSISLSRIFTDLPPNGQSLLALLMLIIEVGTHSFFYDNERFSIEGGSGQLIAHLFSEVRERVSLNTMVDSIRAEAEGVRVTASDLKFGHQAWIARAVIIALPVSLLPSISGLEANTMSGAWMSRNQKITILRRVSNSAPNFADDAIVTDEPCRFLNAARISNTFETYDRIDVLARPSGNLPVDVPAIRQRAIALFRMPDSDDDHTYSHDWTSDRHSLGAYPYYGVGRLSTNDIYGKNGLGQFLFAGDYVLPGLCGYMEGAVRSAQTAASRAIALIRKAPMR